MTTFLFAEVENLTSNTCVSVADDQTEQHSQSEVVGHGGGGGGGVGGGRAGEGLSVSGSGCHVNMWKH